MDGSELDGHVSCLRYCVCHDTGNKPHVISRLSADEGYNSERTRLQLDLCHDLILHDPGHDPGEVIASRIAFGDLWFAAPMEALREAGQPHALNPTPT